MDVRKALRSIVKSGSKRYLVGILAVCFLGNCQNQPAEVPQSRESSRYVIVEVTEDNNTPTVDIEKYTLVVPKGVDRKQDASAILQVKRKWPLAMQSKNPADFDSILAKNFTFTGGGQLYNRDEYIQDRTAPSEWIITHVKYDNLTLQFFGDMALLSYQNRVTNENLLTKAVEIERISWGDMYVKEDDGTWKLSTAHVINYQIEDDGSVIGRNNND